MPDIWFYADCLRESFAELHAAARRAGAPAAPPLPASKPWANGRQADGQQAHAARATAQSGTGGQRRRAATAAREG